MTSLSTSRSSSKLIVSRYKERKLSLKEDVNYLHADMLHNVTFIIIHSDAAHAQLFCLERYSVK